MTGDTKLPQKSEIVIIGGGIIGALSALLLAEAGLKPLVIDKGKDIPNGSTLRSAAGFRQQFGTAINIDICIRSRRFYEEFNRRVSSQERVFHQRGYLFLYRDQSAMAIAEKNVDLQRSRGLSEVEILTPNEVTRRFPWVNSQLSGATFCGTDGFLIPDAVVQASMARACELGATLVKNVEVTRLEISGGSVAAIETTSGRVKTDILINAAGPWSSRVARMAGRELVVNPIKRYLYFIVPGQEGFKFSSSDMQKFPMTICEKPYIRPDNIFSSQFMAGSEHNAEPQPNFSDEDQDRVEPGYFPLEYGVEVLSELASWLPFLGNFAVRRATCGYYEVSEDHNAYVDWDPIVTNMMHATGFSGHGVMQAPGIAEIVRDLICNGGKTFTDIEPLRIGAKRRSTPEPMVF